MTTFPSTAGLRRSVRTQEFVIFAVIVVFCAVIDTLNPAFLSLSNVFELLRLVTVSGILALGVLLVLISGGVDVSFPAIADTSVFVGATILVSAHFQGSAVVLYLISLPFGILMGLLNGFFVARFRLPTLIVTLGTSSLYYGAELYFLGGVSIFDLPQGTAEYSQASLVTVPTASGIGTTALHPAILILVVLAGAVSLLLNKTTLGRAIHALGDNPAVAERSGIRVARVRYFVYATVGALAAIAGATNASLLRNANPISLQGSELAIIAAVVLGGALITGGKGTVTGTLLGVLLIGIVDNSLVLVGVPTTWQNVVIGVVLLGGTVVPAVRAWRRRRVAGGI
ncbi:MAG: putative transporter permease protein [Pseudonocardia sp.]|jgi:simple sugar transport system permease protein|nr:putative transporter permease protein [Pseudonocardia sp.]